MREQSSQADTCSRTLVSCCELGIPHNVTRQANGVLYSLRRVAKRDAVYLPGRTLDGVCRMVHLLRGG